MAKLKIATTLSLPLDAATQTFAFIARKGAGKTYAAGKLAEALLEAGVQVVILDTVGNWYGLRLSQDGKTPGFDIPVLGGLRGDIPLEAAGGSLIADIVVETGRSLVIDVSQFSLGDRKRFATAFGERVWQAKKGERHPSPIHLIIEESQLIVPQDVRGDSAKMVGIFEEIIRLGRNYGIGVSMITQRPQSVNKEVLNQTECLFVGQVNGSQERDALEKWIKHQGMDKGLVDELPSLPIGTFYVWSPQWLNLLEKVTILPKTTYDASATPKVGDKRVQRELKPLDLTELQTRLKATIERQKLEDPRELRKEVARLKTELEKLRVHAAHLELGVGVKVTPKEVFVLKDAQVDKLGRAIEHLGKIQSGHLVRLTAIYAPLTAACADILLAIQKTHHHAAPVKAPRPRAADTTESGGRAVRAEPARSARRGGEHVQGNGNLPGVSQRILDALAELEEIGAKEPNRALAAFLAGYTHTQSKGFVNALGALRTGGLIDYPSQGTVKLTDTGRQAAAGPVVALSDEDVQERVSALLGGATAKVLRPLLQEYPQALPRAEVAESAGYGHVQSKGFVNAIGRLRTLGFIEYPSQGTVRATKLLFPVSEGGV